MRKQTQQTRGRLSLVGATFFICIIVMGCATTHYHPVTKRFKIITLADIPVADEVKQKDREKKLASANSFITPNLNETLLTIHALQGMEDRHSYVEGHFSSIQIPLLFFHKAFYGRKVTLAPIKIKKAEGE